MKKTPPILQRLLSYISSVSQKHTSINYPEIWIQIKVLQNVLLTTHTGSLFPLHQLF